jgi:hypothetical protein
MVITSTASSRVAERIGRVPKLARFTLLTLLVATFVAVQATALAHEFEHVLHQHDAPCGLHVAAEHLVIVAAPVPALAVPLVPSTDAVAFAIGQWPPLSARPSSARAPPLLSC